MIQTLSRFMQRQPNITAASISVMENYQLASAASQPLDSGAVVQALIERATEKGCLHEVAQSLAFNSNLDEAARSAFVFKAGLFHPDSPELEAALSGLYSNKAFDTYDRMQFFEGIEQQYMARDAHLLEAYRLQEADQSQDVDFGSDPKGFGSFVRKHFGVLPEESSFEFIGNFRGRSPEIKSEVARFAIDHAKADPVRAQQAIDQRLRQGFVSVEESEQLGGQLTKALSLQEISPALMETLCLRGQQINTLAREAVKEGNAEAATHLLRISEKHSSQLLMSNLSAGNLIQIQLLAEPSSEPVRLSGTEMAM